MKLYEFQAKQVFAEHGIPVPRGEVAASPEEARAAAERLGRVVVKAQVHTGGRGKLGFIKLANTPDEAAQHRRRCRSRADSLLGRSAQMPSIPGVRAPAGGVPA